MKMNLVDICSSLILGWVIYWVLKWVLYKKTKWIFYCSFTLLFFLVGLSFFELLWPYFLIWMWISLGIIGINGIISGSPKKKWVLALILLGMVLGFRLLLIIFINKEIPLIEGCTELWATDNLSPPSDNLWGIWLEIVSDVIFHTGQLFVWSENTSNILRCGRIALNQILSESPYQWVSSFLLVFVSLSNILTPIFFMGVLIDSLLWFLPILRLYLHPFKIKIVFSEESKGSLLLGRSIQKALDDEELVGELKAHLFASSELERNEVQRWIKKVKDHLFFWLQKSSSPLKPKDILLVYTNWKSDRKSEFFLKAQQMGAICVQENILDLPLGRSKQVVYFLCAEKTSENFSILEQIVNQSHTNKFPPSGATKAYIFVENLGWEERLKNFKAKPSVTNECDIKIQLVKDYSSLAIHLVEKIPLFIPLYPANHLSGQDDENKKLLSILIIGSASRTTELIKIALWAGQMNHVELRITAIGANAQRVKNTLRRQCPDLLNSCKEGDNDKKYRTFLRWDLSSTEYNSPYATLNFIQTEDITRWPEKLLEEAQASNYIICALNSDEENAHLAGDLQRHLFGLNTKNELETLRLIIPFIEHNLSKNAFHLSKETLSEKNDFPKMNPLVIPFSTYEERFSIVSILHLETSKVATKNEELYNLVRKNIKGFHNPNSDQPLPKPSSYLDLDYSRWSNWTRSAQAPYKLFDLDLVKEIDLSVDKVKIEFEKLSEQELTDKVYNELFLRDLSWIEHRRWNAFERGLGYSRLKKGQFGLLSPGQTQLPLMRIHACLCESSLNLSLPKFIRNSSNTNTTQEKDQLDEVGEELIKTYKKSDPNWIFPENHDSILEGDHKIFDLPFMDTGLSSRISEKEDPYKLYEIAQKKWSNQLPPLPSELENEV